MTVLPLLVYRQTGDAGLVGLVGAARLLPWLLLSVPAGAAVDRFPGRRLLLVAESSRACLMLIMAALSIAGAPLALVMTAAMGAVVAGTFAMPAHGRLIPELAGDPESLGSANVVSAALDNLACVIGPALAGLLILTGSLELCFLLNGLSFVVVVAIVGRLPRPGILGGVDTAAAGASSGPDPRSTLASIARSALPRLAMDAAVSFASGALWVLPVLITVDALRADDGVVGLLGLIAGVGGIGGAALAARFVDGQSDQGMAIGLGALVVGLAAIAAGSMFLAAAAAVLVASAALVALDTLNMTELQRTTPPDRLGRTLGILHTSAGGSAMLGSIVPGVAMAAFGIGPACVLVACVVGVVGSLAYLPRMGTPRSREWGSLPMLRPAPKPTIEA